MRINSDVDQLDHGFSGRRQVCCLLLLLLFSLFCLASVPHAWAAITCDTVQSSVTEADPQDVSYTVGTTSTSNRVVIVQTGSRGETGDVVGVTFDGVAMTQIGTTALHTTSNPDIGSALWIKTGVSSGTYPVSVDWTGTILSSTVVVYTCYGVDQTTPVRAGSPNTATASATSVSVAISSAVGDLVIDGVNVGSLGAGAAPAMGASQTEIYAGCIANSGDNQDTCGSTEPGAASVTMSWSAGTSENWATVGASLVAAAAGRGNRRVIELP